MTAKERFDPSRAIAEAFGITIMTDDAVRLHNRLQLMLAAAHHRGMEVERESCAQICADRAKDFQDLLEKYGYEHDDGARVGASQCEELIRARGQQ